VLEARRSARIHPITYTATYERRTFEVTPVYDRDPGPRWIMVRDVETQRCVLVQCDARGRLFGLDEGANEVDPLWLACVLERAEPKPN
jgi:hypothetical protein